MSSTAECVRCQSMRTYGTEDEAWIAEYHASGHALALIWERAVESTPSTAGGGNAESGGRNTTGGEAPAVPTPSEENSPVGGNLENVDSPVSRRESGQVSRDGSYQDAGRQAASSRDAASTSFPEQELSKLVAWFVVRGMEGNAAMVQEALTAHAELRDRFLTEKAQWRAMLYRRPEAKAEMETLCGSLASLSISHPHFAGFFKCADHIYSLLWPTSDVRVEPIPPASDRSREPT